ncbi:hypothetical protein GGX14DRAFT_431356 [Mycena pura]|uniref:Uncharacterized protein n=1 Tax=Mycena pura TaxID=153505 RepID=A0AAD6YHN3_9AGAR|nr:hypothetical protein GGX14DRAFT_431356 [Mycena pura]
MGRRAKHFTTAERASAQKEHYTKYNNSPHGKAVRAAENRLRNRRQVSNWSIPRLLPLSYRIEELAQLPLPENESLFREAFRCTLDERALARWKKEPPFTPDDDPTDPRSREYRTCTKDLVIALHGVRLREQRVRDHRRRDYFRKLGTKGAFDKLREEVERRLQVWERVTALNIYDPHDHSRQYAMLQHFIFWEARTIYHIYYAKFLQ